MIDIRKSEFSPKHDDKEDCVASNNFQKVDYQKYKETRWYVTA